MNHPTLRSLAQKTRDQRWRIARNRLRLEREFVSRTGKPRRSSRGRILSYHSTGTPEWGVNDVSPARFIEQIDRALVLGHRFVPASEIAAGRGGPSDLAITFDDGLRSIMAVTPELEARRIPFAVFAVTEWASEPGQRFLSWADLDGLRDRGAILGSHSVTHANFRSLDRAQRRHELEHARGEFARHLGIQVDEFAIPSGAHRIGMPSARRSPSTLAIRPSTPSPKTSVRPGRRLVLSSRSTTDCGNSRRFSTDASTAGKNGFERTS